MYNYNNYNYNPNPIQSTRRYLVAYFSLPGDTYNVGYVQDGNTKVLGNLIASYLKADQFHIIGENRYPESHMDRIKQANIEMSQNIRPRLISQVNNFAQYDTIFLGYPIWYSKPPMAVFTFLQSYDFTNKKVYLFCTHEGSGESGTFGLIKSILPRAIVSTDGLSMFGSQARTPAARQEVENWLRRLN